jgi:hypothetical protein
LAPPDEPFDARPELLRALPWLPLAPLLIAASVENTCRYSPCLGSEVAHGVGVHQPTILLFVMAGIPGQRGARPNILMFGDYGWANVPYEKQRDRLTAWISSVSNPVVVELGAGRALPKVRRFSEHNSHQGLIQINFREAKTSPLHGIGFEGGAAATLEQIDRQL